MGLFPCLSTEGNAAVSGAHVLLGPCFGFFRQTPEAELQDPVVVLLPSS